MTKRWPIDWLPALFVCFLLVACSNQPTGTGSTAQDELIRQLGTVEKVSVLSTDGTELPLELRDFSHEIAERAAPLQRAATPLAPDQVKFTLIVHRADLAPLVIEVGSKVSQVGEVAYAGEGAEALYQWTREEIGQSLFHHEGVYAIQLTAADQGRTYTLSQEESSFVWKSLQAATYQHKLEQLSYPLYPAYQLELDLGERVLDVAVLTPGLLSVRFGDEVLHYRVTGELFSKLTEWLPPHDQTEGDPLNTLFKATKVQITGTDKSGHAQTWVIGESIEEQGRAHQLVRLLKQATPLKQPPALPEKPLFTLAFQLPGGEQRIDLYEKWFTYNGRIYEQAAISDYIQRLIALPAAPGPNNQQPKNQP